jgi:hypothetical protein
MPATLVVPSFIAEDPEFKKWLKNFPGPWDLRWVKNNKNRHYVSFTTTELIDPDLTHGIALQLAELLELFPNEEWNGEFIIKNPPGRIGEERINFTFSTNIFKNRAFQVVEFDDFITNDTMTIESEVSLDTGKLFYRELPWATEYFESDSESESE